MVKIVSYLTRVDGIFEQYNFARRAIIGYMKHSDPTATARIANLETVLPHDQSADYPISEFRQRFDKYIGSLKTVFPEKHRDLANRLMQNEIILLVAVFEDLMKSIQREVLRHNPTLLNADRIIPLGRLTACGEAKVIAEEIERAVQILDRKSVFEKAQAFEKLSLPWEMEPRKVDAVIRLRNELLHEDVDKLVTGDQLYDCRMVVLELPIRVCSEGAANYPKAFEDTRLLQLFRDLTNERRKNQSTTQE